MRWPVCALIAPKSTRLALAPVIGTTAVIPIGAHAARSGGKKPQQGPVGEQHDIALADARSQATTKAPFFCARCAARSV